MNKNEEPSDTAPEKTNTMHPGTAHLTTPHLESTHLKSAHPGSGRFAPSPTGEFHLGNLRTAFLAWGLARNSGRTFLLRMEDLDDRSRPHFASMQLAALEKLGITWDGPVIYQKERLPLYEEIVADLSNKGLLYECYCTRRELAEAPSAPHQPPGSYPGTCRHLSEEERHLKHSKLTNRGPALRLASTTSNLTITDSILGSYTGTVDDMVIQRGDGVFSYNFVSVLDDYLQNVSQVVRGDDLLSSTPRQVYLQKLLGAPQPMYVHVPMVLNKQGVRLAKRDGAVTLTELTALGWQTDDIVDLLGSSLGMNHPRSAEELREQLPKCSLAQEAFLLDVEKLKEGPRSFLASLPVSD